MPHPEEISAPEALRRLLAAGPAVRCLDVRSPGEFAEGALPGSRNLPILNDEERHAVGLTYKERGQPAAVELGHRLVDPLRAARVAGWREYLAGAEWPLVACWRGGMRSGIAAEWIGEAGGRAVRVQGGYKAIRREALAVFARLPELTVLAGPTGSGKTRFLAGSGVPAVDLEVLAHHRGSAFGAFPREAQPAQATFENALAWEILRRPGGRLLVEDESNLIGRIHVPPPMREAILRAPLLVLRVPLAERVENILAEYVRAPLAAGQPAPVLAAHYRECLARIRNRLGGLLAGEIDGRIAAAFAGAEEELHREWIRDLLVHYYDQAYAYGLARAGRAVAFEGDEDECRNWVRKRFA